MTGIQWICAFSALSAAICSSLAENTPIKRLKLDRNCFCNLGPIGDCSCNVDTVELFNNVKLFPKLRSLLVKNYFRFYKINLHKPCPFWKDGDSCSMASCNVKMCLQEDVPPGLRNSSFDGRENREEMCTKDADLDPNLSHLNTTISADTYKGFERWRAYDVENFAVPDEDTDADYVDLVSNPERYTGFSGFSANRIWKAIYHENCFWMNSISPSELEKICLEKRMFYRVISGLHASINVHLSANYPFSKQNVLLQLKRFDDEVWGPNPAEFSKRFSPNSTAGQGPNWLKNVYFVFLIELRALAKVSSYLQNETLFTGNATDDEETKLAVIDVLNVVNSFNNHFNESLLFHGESNSASLKNEFRKRFRNVTRIMDCVGCEKCKLWGKLQVKGLGTALKILFSGKFDRRNVEGFERKREIRGSFPPKLSRGEIVSLFNAFGRLSYSIHEIERLKRLV